MNFWEIKLAATCVIIGLIGFVVFGFAGDGPVKDRNPFQEAVGLWVAGACFATLVGIGLWCIWGPYRYGVQGEVHSQSKEWEQR